jgi:hypothetical protein
VSATIRNLLTNTTLLLAACLIALLCLEQGFRLWLFGAQAFSVESLRNNVPINNAGFMRQSEFDDIYWELQPNLDVSFKLAHLVTNEHGLADKAYSVTKNPDTVRIAVLGDSYSMASGVDTDKSYHALIEQKWQQDKKPVEIINFAVGGYGLERYNAVLAHRVGKWHPDALLIGYCAFNDHLALPPATGTVPSFNPIRADGFWMSYVLEYFVVRARAAHQTPAELQSAHLTFIEQALARTRKLADEIHPGMPILLAYLDNRPHATQDINAVRALAQRFNIDFVDTTADFAHTRIEDVSIHLLDSHPDVQAHALFAQRLTPGMEALFQNALNLKKTGQQKPDLTSVEQPSPEHSP